MRDELWWLGVAVVIVFAAGLMCWSYDHDMAELRARCDHTMQLARTPRDTLDATIACDRMHDDYATRMAISAAAGAVTAAVSHR